MSEKKTTKKKNTKKNVVQTEAPKASVAVTEKTQSKGGAVITTPKMPKYQTVVVMKDGTEHAVTSESGRYYHTTGGDIRKVNPNIVTVKKVALN